MVPKIFIDGQEGTTGIRLRDLLAGRRDVEVMEIAGELRKDLGERRKMLNEADLVFLCLPDLAAVEAVGMVENSRTKVIDASTAHRVKEDWAYGLPELSEGHRERVMGSKRVGNPGCHATAFLLPVYPLVVEGILGREAVLTCFSLTGYSGGGKKMIAAYEAGDRAGKLKGPRPYALKMVHKHHPEMRVVAGLLHSPMFTPVVCDVYSGLAVEVFLPAALLKKGTSARVVHEVLARHYEGEAFVKVLPFDSEAGLDEGFFDIVGCNGTNRAEIFVFGNEEQVAVITRLDNLGKGAAGAAVQSMNLMLGLGEETGLVV